MCILPPYNNQRAQVILVGDESNLPQVTTDNISVTYEIPGNTYSVGKTNFWTYVFDLFGVNLQDNIGLTGVGLTGNMVATENYFYVDGIPVTPYQDDNLTTEQPFQLALVKAYDAGNNLLASTQPVIPVSNEISCVSSGCHSSETDILYSHEEEGGFDPTATPILCADCHADNALGKPGVVGVPPFSQAIHQAHGEETNDCYKCHPGPNTQCLRDTMSMAGTVCQDCHGSVSNVGQSIQNGREPWLQEPACGDVSCHGANYAEEPGKLFKQSRGHGGLFCSACHGSPHAIVPSREANDNLQNITLQGFRGTLRKCSVCHGYTPPYPGPHGYLPSAIEVISASTPFSTELLDNYPNPFNLTSTIPFRINISGKVDLSIYDSNGKKVMILVNEHMKPGEYQVALSASLLNNGIYFCGLKVNKDSQFKKLIVVK
jgi:hypothetical protein